MEYHLSEKQIKYLPVKRAFDIMIAGTASIFLTPVMAGLAAAIKLDSPGPVLFKQKRVGKDKQIFEIWKFRTMRTDTPKDVPTHLLSDPEAYITKTGRFMRKYSLDELPQLYQCVLGQMSLIGPRPALWNQFDLIAERDKYGANTLTPGLTGWAQINGRDELEIPVKARFDGEYLEKFGPMMDLKCFLGTIGSVLNSDGVVEGGTGALHMSDAAECEEDGEQKVLVSPEKLKKEIRIGAATVCAAFTVFAAVASCLVRYIQKKSNSAEATSEAGVMCQQDAYTGRLHHILRKLLSAGALFAVAATAYTNIKRRVTLQDTLLRPEIDSDTDSVAEESEQIFSPDETLLDPGCIRILITGAHSYIGTSVEAWLLRTPDRYQVDTLDMKDSSWRDYDFSGYDVVFHVAGIAHSDVGDATEEQKRLYYQVNTDLAVETAQKAKNEGVGQFIFMSSMIIYSGCGNAHITADTIPNPLNFYGDSKWQADCRIRTMEDAYFKVVVLRPPMIYGKGSKGNYPLLAKMAGMLPVFPVVRNKRSMLYIENLCRFVQLMIDNEESGIFFPQNGEYTNTSDMVQMIANARRHRMLMLPFADIPVRLLSKAPGKIGALVQKAFGDSTYDMDMSEYREDYRVRTLAESIRLTETLD